MSGFSKAVWTEQGPGPLALPDPGYSKSAGAVQALAPDPVDPDRLFIASVGGGIWMTTNAVSANDPTWTPLTDQQPSLSMAAIAFSPLDATRNTLFAGYGATSHSQPLVGPISGPLLGLLKTTDGGQCWTELARGTFQGTTVTRILPRAEVTDRGEVLLVATWGNGLQRSDDGGQTWRKLPGLGEDHISDIIADPGDPRRVYASNFMGVFRSDDGGDQAWIDVSAGLRPLPPFPVIKLSFAGVPEHDGHQRLYAVIENWPHGWGLFWTTDLGTTWTNLGKPPPGTPPPGRPTGQGVPMPPMIASPVRSDLAFCFDDQGYHWTVTAGAPGERGKWAQIEYAVGAAGGPHTDARDFAFSADANVLFDADDGGVYRLVNAHGALPGRPREWQQAVGSLRVTEFHAIAYDALHHVLFGAAQDNAIPHQTVPDGTDWGLNEDPYGDGFCVGVDSSGPEASVHYSSQQSLGEAQRVTYTSPTHGTSEVMELIVNGTGLTVDKVEGAFKHVLAGGSTIRRNQNWVVNALDGKRILLGTDFLYESFNQGKTIDSLGGLAKNAIDEWVPANPLGTISAYAYGHPSNPDVIYLGAGGRLLLRSGSQGLPTLVANYPGSTPVGISLGPTWLWAYVLDDGGRVHRTLDGGETWRDLTGNLPALSGHLRALEVMDTVTAGDVIFVGGDGGVFVCRNPGDGKFAFWQKHGTGMPNAIVTGVHYARDDDVLFAGTLGRSAWSVKDARGSVIGGPRLGIQPRQRSSCLGGWLADATITFTAVIGDEQDLTPPLSFAWNALGAARLASVVPWQISVTMPAAGQEVDVTLTVTDATGFKLFGALSDMTISPQVMIWRETLCELIHLVETTAIFNSFVNPLGPPVEPVYSPVTREMYAELQEVARRMNEVLTHLVREDGGRVAPAPAPFDTERDIQAWKLTYPSRDDAKYVVPPRTDDDAMRGSDSDTPPEP